MRLLFVIDHFGSGGAQRQMVNLGCGLAARGHEVEFFVYHDQYRFFRSMVETAGIRIHEARKTDRLGLGVLLALRALLRGGHYDAALAYLETPSLCVEVASIGLSGVPVVVSERVDPDAGSGGARRAFAIQMHRLATRVVANSGTCAEQLGRRHPWLVPRLQTIRNGVDLGEFSPPVGEERRSSARLRLLAVGTVTPRKNAHGLVEALVELRRQVRVLPVVTWVGKLESDEASVRYRRELQAALERHDLLGSWIWAGEQARIAPLMREADALIHPSLREGLANVICEALACGLPVLVSDRGENGWLAGGGRRGFVFDPESAAGIAETIGRFSSLGGDARREMSEAGCAFARQELSLEAFVVRYEQLFRELS